MDVRRAPRPAPAPGVPSRGDGRPRGLMGRAARAETQVVAADAPARPAAPPDLGALLAHAVERKASDLHLKVPARPIVRVNGELEQVPGTGALTGDDTLRFARGAARGPGRQARGVRGDGGDRPVARPRGPRPLPREHLPPARLDLDRPARRALQGDERRGPPAAAGRRDAGRRGARDRAGDRHDRLRQEHDARGDDRPDQPDVPQARGDDRGPDRDAPRGPRVADQPARGGPGHRVVRHRAAPRAAAGPRRDHDRRDPRPGHDGDRPERRGDRPPGAVHDAHAGRHRDGEPRDRLLPAPPAAAGAGDARRARCAG